MKKHCLKTILSVLMTMAVIFGLSSAAFAADSSVAYEDGKIIVFEPGNVYSDTDLFDDLKGAMPGDTCTEKVEIVNNITECDYIKVYMRAILHDETGNPISENVLALLAADERREPLTETEYMYDFLSQLSMKVSSGTEVLFEGSPDRTGSLTENVFIASLRKGESAKLDVELTLPIEMGNEYSNRIGEVDWVFAVEEFDDPEPGPADYEQLTVRKIWVDDNVDRPEKVTVQLMKDGEVSETIELNSQNQWVYTWSRLEKEYTWSALEKDVPDGYDAAYDTTENITTITNKKKNMNDDPQDAEPVDLTVVKKWDDNGKDRPDSVKVTLYNGDTAVESVWLGAWNNWSYAWKDLDGKDSWQIIETDIPKGYTPSYYYSDGVVTVTNTASLIYTGQLSWPIPVLGGLGLLLIAGGFIMMILRRKNKHV